MEKKKLSRSPIQVNPHCWYYEEEKGISVISEVYDKNGNFLKAVQNLIPKGLLKKTMKKYI